MAELPTPEPKPEGGGSFNFDPKTGKYTRELEPVVTQQPKKG
jgi:hypothetical protein